MTDECKKELVDHKKAIGNNQNDFVQLCGELATCKNEAGGYFCECHKGFVFNEESKACMGKINNPSS